MDCSHAPQKCGPLEYICFYKCSCKKSIQVWYFHGQLKCGLQDFLFLQWFETAYRTGHIWSFYPRACSFCVGWLLCCLALWNHIGRIFFECPHVWKKCGASNCAYLQISYHIGHIYSSHPYAHLICEHKLSLDSWLCIHNWSHDLIMLLFSCWLDKCWFKSRFYFASYFVFHHSFLVCEDWFLFHSEPCTGHNFYQLHCFYICIKSFFRINFERSETAKLKILIVMVDRHHHHYDQMRTWYPVQHPGVHLWQWILHPPWTGELDKIKI